MIKYDFPEEVVFVIKQLNLNGFEGYIVGGSIRDIILNRPVHDFDITTNATPFEVIKIFNKTIETGLKHGTVTALINKMPIEITTYRFDGIYLDFRHPENVTFSKKIEDDLKRRDFTINSFAFNPVTNEFIDLFNGISDLNDKVIKAIGNPEDRFNEDALRMMRAIRFSSQLGFDIEEKTFKSILSLKDNLSHISIERKRDEFLKILLSSVPSVGINLLNKSGILKDFLPELFDCIGVNQNEYHLYDVYNHILKSVDVIENDMILRLTMLFHDIAKPETKQVNGNGKVWFFKHNEVGSEKTEKILERLKFPNKTIKLVSHLVLNHMFEYCENWKDSDVRKFIQKTGEENLEYIFKIREADLKSLKSSIVADNYKELIKRIKKMQENPVITQINQLAVTGEDLMKELKLKPSKQIGVLLNAALDCVIENPDCNTKEYLINFLKNKIWFFYKKQV